MLECDHALLTLDGRYLIFVPGCIREAAVDLKTGELIRDGAVFDELRDAHAMPLTSVLHDPRVDEKVAAHLERRWGPPDRRRGYRTYRLPSSGWGVQFQVDLGQSDGDRARGRKKPASFDGKLRYEPFRSFVADYHHREGLRAHLAHDWEAALGPYQQALAADPLHRESAYNLVAVLAHLGRRDAAIGELAMVIAFWPPLHAKAAADEDLDPLRSDPRFQRLTAPIEVVVDMPPIEVRARERPKPERVTSRRMAKLHKVFRKEADGRYSYDLAAFHLLVPTFGDFVRQGDLRFDPEGEEDTPRGWYAKQITWRSFWNAIGFKRSGFRIVCKDGGVQGELELRRIYGELMAGKTVTVQSFDPERTIVMFPREPERHRGPTARPLDSPRVRKLMK